ncbi:MAG TPA: MarR family transcriptional regulator, partial [Polyangiaceae bacterium]
PTPRGKGPRPGFALVQATIDGARHATCSGIPRMNEIAFGTKRAFHGFLRVSRKLLAAHGLTAARFDLLYAIARDAERDEYPPSALQSTIRKKLGVTAPVVSRMTRALERLGWVTRTACRWGDRRQRTITLTAQGFAAWKVVRRVVLRSILRLVYPAICFGMERDPTERLVAMDTLEGYLRGLRSHFGDRATIYFPWGHPDD